MKPQYQPKKHYYPKQKYKVREDRHSSSLLTDHIVLIPKFRASILTGAVAAECERQIRWTCKCLDVKILEMAVSEDHVHLFLQYPPKLSVSTITGKIKANSSRQLRKKYPHLICWNKNGLWTTGCFHGSVGQGFDVVERYIARQKHYH